MTRRLRESITLRFGRKKIPAATIPFSRPRRAREESRGSARAATARPNPASKDEKPAKFQRRWHRRPPGAQEGPQERPIFAARRSAQTAPATSLSFETVGACRGQHRLRLQAPRFCCTDCLLLVAMIRLLCSIASRVSRRDWGAYRAPPTLPCELHRQTRRRLQRRTRPLAHVL